MATCFPPQLRKILATGIVPTKYAAHMMTLIEETPPTVLLCAVRKAAFDTVCDAQAMKRKIMKNITGMAKIWKIKRFEF